MGNENEKDGNSSNEEILLDVIQKKRKIGLEKEIMKERNITRLYPQYVR